MFSKSFFNFFFFGRKTWNTLSWYLTLDQHCQNGSEWSVTEVKRWTFTFCFDYIINRFPSVLLQNRTGLLVPLSLWLHLHRDWSICKRSFKRLTRETLIFTVVVTSGIFGTECLVERSSNTVLKASVLYSSLAVPLHRLIIPSKQ